MIVEGIVSPRVMKYGRRNSEEEEEELHVAKRGKKRDCPFGVEMRSFLGSGRVSEKSSTFCVTIRYHLSRSITTSIST